MYNIEWDQETGGILLNSKATNGTLAVSPRPVFYEELDLLGLDSSKARIRQGQTRCRRRNKNIGSFYHIH
ncbi:MAG: hypothetical protein E7032_08090 [Akkermansiaceae bacterium]|nr:hypothetical protein [Akkermansiaceae bacterium]